MPISTLCAKSTPAMRSRKPCTKCWRDCSPSLSTSIPASSCSLIASSVASSLAASSSSPDSRHGAHSRSGSASQEGLGRLPAMVVGNMRSPWVRRGRGPWSIACARRAPRTAPTPAAAVDSLPRISLAYRRQTVGNRSLGAAPMKWLLAMALCAFTTPALAQNSIKIAITGPFTGGSAPMGTSARDGAKLAIAEITAAGGIQVGAKKLKIEAIERDDEAKNERGALIGQELAAMSDLSGVIGSVNTGVVLAGDKYLQDKGITRIITPAAGSASMTQWAKPDGPKDLFMFRFAAHDGIQAAMVVEEAIARKFTKVAIFADATNYGVSGRDDLLDQIKKQGAKLEVVTVEKWAIGDKDMSAQLLKAKALGAQAILIWGIGPELAASMNAFERGVIGSSMKVCGDGAIAPQT